MKSTSFVQSFMVKVLHEDLGMISSFFILADPHAVFMMFSLCYIQRPSYLFHTMFPSSSILQHYVEFHTRTIITLEKFISARSFGGSIDPLTHY
jgi:hypothetical protein